MALAFTFADLHFFLILKTLLVEPPQIKIEWPLFEAFIFVVYTVLQICPTKDYHKLIRETRGQ